MKKILLILVLLLISGCQTEFNVKTGSIQDAINNAEEGSIITIQEGTYEEEIVINKPITIISENAIIETPGTAFMINSNDVTIKGFTIKNTEIAILVNANNCNLENNTIKSSLWGIILKDSNNCVIFNNIIENCEGFLGEEDSPSSIIHLPSSGIQLINSNENLIKFNYLLDNINGIDLSSSADNVIYANIVERSERIYHDSRYNNGIGVFDNSPNNIISDNAVQKYEDCIDFAKAPNSQVINNSAWDCGGAIGLNHGSSNSLVEDNFVKDSAHGILLWDSNTNVIIRHNDIYNNVKGVSFYDSSDNIIENCEFKDNEMDIYSENSDNSVIDSTFETHEEINSVLSF